MSFLFKRLCSHKCVTLLARQVHLTSSQSSLVPPFTDAQAFTDAQQGNGQHPKTDGVSAEMLNIDWMSKVHPHSSNPGAVNLAFNPGSFDLPQTAKYREWRNVRG
jgi:hypothetical protein